MILLNHMKIISIDPGYERVGIAILEKIQGGKEMLLYSDCFKTLPKKKMEERIFEIGTEVARVIKKYNPEKLAIEKLYFENNQKTAMGVSEARGVIIYEGMRKDLEILEYTPLQIKVAVTGYGKSDKRAVMDMVSKLIVLPQKKMIDDEYDAIAIGLTAFACIRTSPQPSPERRG